MDAVAGLAALLAQEAFQLELSKAVPSDHTKKGGYMQEYMSHDQLM